MKKVFTILAITFCILFVFNSEILAQGTGSRSLTVEPGINKADQKFVLELSSDAENILRKYKIRLDRKNNLLIFTTNILDYTENGQPIYQILRLKGKNTPNKRVVIKAEDQDTVTLKFYEIDGGTGSATIAFGQFIPEMN